MFLTQKYHCTIVSILRSFVDAYAYLGKRKILRVEKSIINFHQGPSACAEYAHSSGKVSYNAAASDGSGGYSEVSCFESDYPERVGVGTSK